MCRTSDILDLTSNRWSTGGDMQQVRWSLRLWTVSSSRVMVILMILIMIMLKMIMILKTIVMMIMT